MSRPPDNYLNPQDKRHIIDKEDVFDLVCLVFVCFDFCVC